MGYGQDLILLLNKLGKYHPRAVKLNWKHLFLKADCLQLETSCIHCHPLNIQESRRKKKQILFSVQHETVA